MVKFNKEGIELIRNKIDSKDLKELDRIEIEDATLLAFN